MSRRSAEGGGGFPNDYASVILIRWLCVKVTPNSIEETGGLCNPGTNKQTNMSRKVPYKK